MSTKDVDAWFAKLDHPLKVLMLQVRGAILKADGRMEESIKWQSPTFSFNGNLASINPRSKKHVSLMFHTGARIPGSFPSLEGSGDTARYLAFRDEKDLRGKRRELESIVKAWCRTKADGAG